MKLFVGGTCAEPTLLSEATTSNERLPPAIGKLPAFAGGVGPAAAGSGNEGEEPREQGRPPADRAHDARQTSKIGARPQQGRIRAPGRSPTTTRMSPRRATASR